MLQQLHISNLAVIADATVEFDGGLNCFTGQTGAGKSLVIGALEVLLGLKAPQDMLRKGASEGRVSGVFAIRNKKLREELAAATDLPLDGEEELIMARRIHESGRTSASINGHPITSAMLKAVGEILVDVHGQHDAQFLLKPANQLQVIDEFGGSTELRAEFAELFHERQGLVSQQGQLNASRTLRKQQLELYEFQAGEIDDAQLVAGEHEELQARHKVMSNLERIKKEASIAYGGLYEDEGAIVARLKSVFALLSALAEVDEGLSPIAQQVRDATVNLDDAAYTLRRHIDKLDLDPAELTQIFERLNLVTRMVDKYAGHAGTLADVIAYREQIGGQIAELKSQDQDFSEVAGRIVAIEKKLKEVGASLTKARKKAVEKLLPRVHEQLSDLGMKEARFAVEFSTIDDDVTRSHEGTKPGKEVSKLETKNLKLGLADFSTSAGMETVEFMIAPNPGQPARPLRKVASGGELSRVMLALKSILAQADRVSVLVFDEIDANVGGRMGSIIGEKLRDLAKIHQVLCITHLPQIAAFADRHLTIRKSVRGSETSTTVQTMEGDARLHELAEMITGKDVSETSLAQARELMGLGAKKKKK